MICVEKLVHAHLFDHVIRSFLRLLVARAAAATTLVAFQDCRLGRHPGLRGHPLRHLLGGGALLSNAVCTPSRAFQPRTLPSPTCPVVLLIPKLSITVCWSATTVTP